MPLQQSGTVAEVEVEAVLNQIQAVMTSGQITAIKEMCLTPDSMREMVRQ